jgi:hypothetical protein
MMVAALNWAICACSGNDTPVDVLSPLEVTGDIGADGQGRTDAPVDVVKYPFDHLLRINHIQVKGTHNSYHLRPEELASEQWDYSHAPLAEQLELWGVRQVELDVHWHSDVGGFRVYHLPVLDDRSTCDTLVQCLAEMKEWSDANPDHHVLFILIEPKDEIDLESIVGRYDDLDGEIRSIWPADRMITPDTILGDHDNLEQAIQADGWPTLGDSRGKVLFHLLDSGHHRDNYLAANDGLRGRVMFVRGGPGEPWGGIVEVGDARGRDEHIAELVRAGFLVRSASDSTDPAKMAQNPQRAAAALAAGSHLISTDFPAPGSPGEFWFDIPDGTPSRCNPLNLVQHCTSKAIEDLGN